MKVTFETLPNAVSELIKKVELLTESINANSKSIEPDKWFTLDELVQYDPAKRTKSTLYGLVHAKKIPVHKRGKRLLFLKSEIDEWLRAASRVSLSDVEHTKDLNNGK
ncbi:MAG: helix-turn-helix domain-containing protein [Bacteroidia bacterium]